jgi:hypothetical protein
MRDCDFDATILCVWKTHLVEYILVVMFQVFFARLSYWDLLALLSLDKIVLSVLAKYFSEVPGKGAVLNLVFCSSRSFELCVIELGVLKNAAGAVCWSDPGNLNIRCGHAQCSQYGLRVTTSYHVLRYIPNVLNLFFRLFLDFPQLEEMTTITSIKLRPFRHTSRNNLKMSVELFTLPLPGFVQDKAHLSSSVRKVFACKFKASIY